MRARRGPGGAALIKRGTPLMEDAPRGEHFCRLYKCRHARQSLCRRATLLATSTTPVAVQSEPSAAEKEPFISGFSPERSTRLCRKNDLLKSQRSHRPAAESRDPSPPYKRSYNPYIPIGIAMRLSSLVPKQPRGQSGPVRVARSLRPAAGPQGRRSSAKRRQPKVVSPTDSLRLGGSRGLPVYHLW